MGDPGRLNKPTFQFHCCKKELNLTDAIITVSSDITEQLSCDSCDLSPPTIVMFDTQVVTLYEYGQLSVHV